MGRGRRHNARALTASLALIGLAVLCAVVLPAVLRGAARASPTGPGSATSTTAAKPRPKPRPKPGPRPATATSTSSSTPSSTSTVPSTTTTTTTTIGTTIPVTRLPATAPATAPRTTTTFLRTTATVVNGNSPRFCTVTVRLGTGAGAVYHLDPFVANPGDEYDFTAALGGYHVEVATTVVTRAGANACASTLSHLAHD